MPVPSPFHPRTSKLCRSLRWKDWAGMFAVCSYDTYHEREYFALRHGAGMVDVSPLFKYEVSGRDAAAFLSWVMVRDISRLEVGRVAYGCWCDEEGKLLDDGTVARLGESRFRVTANEPNLAWFRRNGRGFEVRIEDETERIAALSLQGPTSREILGAASDAQMEALSYFGLTQARFDGFEAVITRTGYTGDLGYEVWVEAERALALWDALREAGAGRGLEPVGLDAYDMARIEAGFLMNGVDYFSANQCPVDSRKSTPYEAGLGWTVNLKRGAFVGREALRAERTRGPARRFVGLEIDWEQTERLYERAGLPPQLPALAWRNAVPVYDATGAQIGRATSGVWSPLLKKNLALATLRRPHGKIGEELRIETTVEYVRHLVKATVRKRPFFDPERKRA